MSDHLPVPAGSKGGVDGLEEVDASDITTPILKLDHESGRFVLSLTNEEFDSVSVVMLGLVKQRILWPAEPGAKGEQPLCRSYDHKVGHPDAEKFHLTTKGASGFPLDRVMEGRLPCDTCNLKEWDTNPKSGAPWCNEQYTVPVLIVRDGKGNIPALLSFTRTGIKPIKTYISGFVAAGEPLYTYVTTLSSVMMRKGTAEYAVPKFTKGAETDPVDWPEYSKNFAGIRRFISAPRRREDDAEVEVEVEVRTAPTATESPSGTVSAKRSGPEAAPAPAPAASIPDDEEPF